MRAQLPPSRRQLHHVVRGQALVGAIWATGSSWPISARMCRDAADVDVVVELVHRRLAPLVAEPHVPAVGQGVVVEALLAG